MLKANQKPVVCTIGSHSALEIFSGAKKHGFETLAICAKDREKVYSEYYKTRTRKFSNEKLGIVDDVILLNKFKDLADKKILKNLGEKNVAFVPHKSLTAYLGYEFVEKDFNVPIYGNRKLIKIEDRTYEKNQDWVFEKAGIRVPKKFGDYSKIDRLAIVKTADESRSFYERAFFFASSPKEFEQESKKMIEKGKISKKGLENAVIEEVVMGAQVNYNYFYSPLLKEIELMGTDMRRQTNYDGLLRLTADKQLKVLEKTSPSIIEVGHIACTIRESLLENAFELGEKFVKACRLVDSKGVIGPFALQGALVTENGKEEMIVFDAGVRVPGSPGIGATPYSEYLYGHSVSVGERMAIELKNAVKQDMLDKLLT